MSPTNNEDGAAPATAPATPNKPTDKQLNLLAIIMQNLRNKPEVNWANVVLQSGLKNEKVAKETYRKMNKKFGWCVSDAGSPSGSASGSATSTPTKVQKRTGKVGTKSVKKITVKKVKKEEEDEAKKAESDENDESDEDDCV